MSSMGTMGASICGCRCMCEIVCHACPLMPRQAEQGGHSKTDSAGAHSSCSSGKAPGLDQLAGMEPVSLLPSRYLLRGGGRQEEMGASGTSGAGHRQLAGNQSWQAWPGMFAPCCTHAAGCQPTRQSSSMRTVSDLTHRYEMSWKAVGLPQLEGREPAGGREGGPEAHQQGQCLAAGTVCSHWFLAAAELHCCCEETVLVASLLWQRAC